MASLLIRLLLTALFTSALPAYASKLTVPMALNIVAVATTSEIVQVTVYLTAQRDIKMGELVVHAPDGAMLTEGQVRWEGNLDAGGNVKLVSRYEIEDVDTATAVWKAVAQGDFSGIRMTKLERVELATGLAPRAATKTRSDSKVRAGALEFPGL